MNCCRCHDHKYDPLTRRDYYSLTAFFNQTPVTGEGGDPQSKPNLELPTPEQEQKREALQAAFASAVETVEAFEKIFFPRPEGQLAADSERAAALPDNLKSSLKTSASARNRNQLSELEKHFESSAPDYFQKIKQLREIQESRDQLNRAIARVMIMEDMKTPRKTFLLERGLYNKPGEEVLAAVPVSLPPLPPDAPPNRLALAHWLVSPQNPLAARVTVNRFWQQFFGTGLVKTPEDFGVQGEFPVHPELLEWLASDFIRSGWNVKQLCRAIVTSATYRFARKRSGKSPARARPALSMALLDDS
jgi:hypothetical protein